MPDRSSQVIEPVFDWYRATVPAHHLKVLEALKTAIPEAVEDRGKGRFNYLERTSLQVDGENLVNVLHGGPNGNPSVESTGDNAPALARLLRHYWPVHRPSRIDVALDMQRDGLFASMDAVMREWSDRYRLNLSKVENHDPRKGDTYYLGARSSAVFVRCYEKGKQLQDKMAPGRSLGWDNWVRLELECKPLKPFRETAAVLEPLAFWGLSGWTQSLLKRVLDMDVQPLRMRPQRVADHERAMRSLVVQYGPTLLKELAAFKGDEVACATELFDRILKRGEWADSDARFVQYTPSNGWRHAS